MEHISIKEIGITDCTPDLLVYFNRYQESPRNWHNENGQWILCDELFIEDWDNAKKKQVINGLHKDIEDGGSVIGVYHEGCLIGFASLRANRFGSVRQYAEVRMMHISNGFRGQGIGKRLFHEICIKARQAGVMKLYISANPAEDSVAFYRKVGCVEAVETNQAIQENAPDDYQFEYSLFPTKPPIHSRCLLLRPLAITDAEAIFTNWVNDPDNIKYMRFGKPAALQDVVDWLVGVESEGDGKFTWGFVCKQSGVLIGSGGLYYRDDHNCFEFGLGLMKSKRGLGLASEAAHAMFEFARDALGQGRIYAEHAQENEAAAHMVKRLGFTYQGDGELLNTDGNIVLPSRTYSLKIKGE